MIRGDILTIITLYVYYWINFVLINNVYTYRIKVIELIGRVIMAPSKKLDEDVVDKLLSRQRETFEASMKTFVYVYDEKYRN